MKLYKGQIPFRTNPDGSKIFLDYDPSGYYSNSTEHIDNYIFEDILSYITYGRGRSSITFHFESIINNNKYSMFVSNMDEILKQGLCVQELSGFWTFRKQGANYGIVYLGKEYEHV